MNHLVKGAAIIGLSLFVQCTAQAAAGENPGVHHAIQRSGFDTIHSIQVSKSQTSKKHKILLYPDARQQVLFFSAKGEEGKVYQLFLFDMDGRLVSQTRIRSRETTVLTNIPEGNFLFEVFTDDERIENGQLTVR
ncbi:MAG TPA: T9SS type A sorting domain-containing protein [Puia sp.]|nr:T9SS type A sorting domain-containing protein [Puia sp.]